MGLEAVPCVLRSAANDGNSSSYCTIGFLIRPSSSSNNNNVQAVSNATASSTTSVALPASTVTKSLHVLPATIQKQPATLAAAAPKLVVPGVLRLQPAPCTSATQPHQQTLFPTGPPPPPLPPSVPVQHQHIQHQQQRQSQQRQQHHPWNGDGWLHATSRSNISSGSFESPSPSQVVPQVNVSESYDCQMPCTSTTTFFPPISSITQSFSTGKSDIDLLQEMTHHVDLNPSVMQHQQQQQQQQQSHHESDKAAVRLMTGNDYTQRHKNVTPPPPSQQHNQQHRYHHALSMIHMQNSACASIQSSYNTHTQMDMNSMITTCRYQNHKDCSVTPDSGIQSIADSPPADPFTPSASSPTTHISSTMNSTNDGIKQPQPTNRNFSDDFSDMPHLIPFHQMEVESSLSLIEEGPPFTENTIKTAEVAVATSVDEDEVEVTSESQEKVIKEMDNSIPKIAITPAMNVSELVEQLMLHMDSEQRKQFASAIQSKVAIEDTVAPSVHSGASATSTVAVSGFEGVESTTVTATTTPTTVSTCDTKGIGTEFLKKNCENEVAIQTEFSATPKVRSRKSRSVESKAFGSKGEIQEKKRRSRKRKVEVYGDLTMEKITLKAKKQESTVLDDCAVQCTLDEKTAKGNVQKDAFMPSFSMAAEMEMPTEERKCKLRREQVQKKCVGEKKVPVGKFQKTKEIHKDQELLKKMDGGESGLELQCLDENMVDQIREFHLDMRRKMNEQLKVVIERVGKEFASLELNFGERMHWDLPWYHLNWEQLERRIAEKNTMRKQSRQKSSNAKLQRTAENSKFQKVNPSKKINTFVTSAASSFSHARDKECRSSTDYVKLKQNVIVDAYPKIEQMQCSCSSGCCGESDKCLNRVVLMECSSSCPRNAQCSNKRMFRRECVERLRTFETLNGCGVGVKTDVHIEKGQFICEYIGEIVSIERFNIRSRTDYRYQQNHYALNLCPGFVVDAYRKGNIARFINHSCAPNCEMQRWSVNGQYRIGLFALRAIREGDELTYDYNWDAFEFDDVTVCYCGAANCRRFLNKNVIMNNREKEIARNAGLLLLRNVRKSAAFKLRKFKKDFRSRNQSMNSKSSPADTEVQLVQLCQEVRAQFAESKVASKKQLKKLSNFVNQLYEQRIPLRTVPETLDSIELKINALLVKSRKPLDRSELDVWRASFALIKEKYLRQTRKSGKIDQQQQISKKCKVGSHRTLTAGINYEYLDSDIPVGSYDHDSLSNLSSADANTDCVRCICGTTDDDGPMIQCEQCNFWLHEECVFDEKPSDVDKDFICIICSENAQRTPTISIPLRIQPDFNFKNCTYYRTLVNSRNLQVRLSETVYVQKLENDNHKLILRRLVECIKKASAQTSVLSVKQGIEETCKEFLPVSFHRRSVRCFRIERLFSFEGHQFVFGFYYARPHEVYCEPGRLFHEKELFATNMYDTLPLDAVVGRCLALDPTVYCLGRPRLPHYEEADVYFVEYQTGKNSKFEKIPTRNQYCINTDPLIFLRFEKELTISRTFTPFVMEQENKNLRFDASEYSKSVFDKNRKRRVANLELILRHLPVAKGRAGTGLIKAQNSTLDKSSGRKHRRQSRH